MDQPRSWRLTYGEQPGQRALAFYKRLRWTEWTRCPDCDTPNNLPVAVCPICNEENPVHGKANELACRVCGSLVPVAQDQWIFRCKQCGKDLRDVPVLTGVVRVGGDPSEMFYRGEIAMMLDHVNPDTIDQVLSMGGLRPDQVGFGPPPEAPGGTHAALTGGTAWCLNAQATRDPRILKAAWEFLLFECSEEAQRILTDVYVKRGYPHLVRPQLLKQFGYEEEYDDYEPTFRKALEDAPKYGRVQPHDLHYQHVEGVELAVPVDTIVFQGGQYKDPAKTIRESMDKVNQKLYRIVPPEVKRQRDWWATLVFCIAVPCVLAAFIYALRANREMSGSLKGGGAQAVGGGAGRRRNLILAWCVMAPALLTVTLWQYLPLVRGTAMAFFDYKIYGGGKFIGLQNFIEVLTSPDFWNSVRATVFYVGTSLGIGFCAPILLALLLSEVPKGKMLFRTIFYLPAITTGLVIMFLWKMFYAPTPTGFLNRIMMPVLHFFHVVGQDVTYIDWLHTPGLAMLCVVIPGVWAGAGPGSLIYLAALKTVPEDLYESIAIDGGTALDKVRHVMLPALWPLIMINFIGAFIGAFQAMQNVFVMTGGGPANSTMVLGIQIWSNAFLYLRFGYATAMAWVLGSVLIGFTVLQLRILKRVEFRTAHQVE
jgi:multiple sugar transport system permease protein